MNLTPREIDKLHISMAAEVARKRKGRGLKLNHPESVALIADHILEGARDGKSVSDLMSSGKNVLKKEVTSSDVATVITLLAANSFSCTTGAQIPVDAGNERVI